MLGCAYAARLPNYGCPALRCGHRPAVGVRQRSAYGGGGRTASTANADCGARHHSYIRSNPNADPHPDRYGNIHACANRHSNGLPYPYTYADAHPNHGANSDADCRSSQHADAPANINAHRRADSGRAPVRHRSLVEDPA